MPEEVKDVEKFIELSKRALACRIKRGKEFVKLKLRTKRKLYTIKLPPEKAEEVLSRIECEVEEV